MTLSSQQEKIAWDKRTRNIRKVYTALAMIGEAIILLIMGFTVETLSQTWCVVLICIMIAGTAWTYGGITAAYLDLSPGKYSPHLMGLGNSLATLPGIFGNLSVAWFNGNYQNIYIVAGCVALVGVIPTLFVRGLGRDQQFEKKTRGS